ncbi:MAG TPA: hypothetical protein VIM11_23370 [Tepidisphaeraceae bacterium]|jgi:hypothetical protein
MFEGYLGLPWWLRLIFTGIVFCIGLFILLFVAVRTGFVILGASLAMFIFGTRSQSEKGGYNF